MDATVQFDRGKFKEAIWFLASYCPPAELGNVKLHKMLYFADMMHFLDTGAPMTGVEYQKQKFGPTARFLTSALSELVSEGRLTIRQEDFYGYLKKAYVSTAPFRPTKLSGHEVELLTEVADFVRGKTAKEISELSHNAAWDAADFGETIPYFTAPMMVPMEIEDKDRAWAMEIARQYADQNPF